MIKGYIVRGSIIPELIALAIGLSLMIYVAHF